MLFKTDLRFEFLSKVKSFSLIYRSLPFSSMDIFMSILELLLLVKTGEFSKVGSLAESMTTKSILESAYPFNSASTGESF